MVKKIPIIREIFKGDHNAAAAAARKRTQKQTRPTHWRPMQITKASDPSCDLEGGAQGQI